MYKILSKIANDHYNSVKDNKTIKLNISRDIFSTVQSISLEIESFEAFGFTNR